MPHIFYERLERRRSTQSILGNLPTNGLSGFSSFYSSAPYSMSGPYGFPLGSGPWDGMIFEASKSSIWKSQIQNYQQTPIHYSTSWDYLNNWTSPIKQPWLTPSSWPSTQFSPNKWTSPFIQEYPIGFGHTGGGLVDPDFGNLGIGLGNLGIGSGINIYGPMGPYGPIGTCYLIGGMSNFGGMSGIGGGMSGVGGGISKLEKVRKNLLAFFRNKGILNDKQRQRLLSLPFDKA